MNHTCKIEKVCNLFLLIFKPLSLWYLDFPLRETLRLILSLFHTSLAYQQFPGNWYSCTFLNRVILYKTTMHEMCNIESAHAYILPHPICMNLWNEKKKSSTALINTPSNEKYELNTIIKFKKKSEFKNVLFKEIFKWKNI